MDMCIQFEMPPSGMPSSPNSKSGLPAPSLRPDSAPKASAQHRSV